MACMYQAFERFQAIPNHESVSSLSSITVQATIEDVKALSAVELDSSAVLSLVLDVTTNPLHIHLCDEHKVDGEHNVALKQDCTLSAAESHMIALCVRAVKRGMTVHVLLLGCNMKFLSQQLAQLCDQKCEAESVELSVALQGIHIMYTLGQFPSGCTMLPLAAYSQYTSLTLVEHESRTLHMLRQWRDEYEASQIVDPSSVGLPPIDQCVAWGTLEQIRDELNL